VLLLPNEWETGGWPTAVRLHPVLRLLRGLYAMAIVRSVAGYALER
jgi:hypothetical protein